MTWCLLSGVWPRVRAQLDSGSHSLAGRLRDCNQWLYWGGATRCRVTLSGVRVFVWLAAARSDVTAWRPWCCCCWCHWFFSSLQRRRLSGCLGVSEHPLVELLTSCAAESVSTISFSRWNHRRTILKTAKKGFDFTRTQHMDQIVNYCFYTQIEELSQFINYLFCDADFF